ncbi:MAG: agmatinase [Actinomycetes bacterium]
MSGFLRPDGPHDWPSTTYAGVMSFGRAPYSRQLDGVDLAILGVPLDLATTGRSGAREGPNAIRIESAKLAELSNFPHGFDPVRRRRIVDCGDVSFDTNRAETVEPAVHGAAAEILAAGARVVGLGGDHFASYPLLRAAAEHHGSPLALVHFDAHSDTWPDDGDRLDHGSMFRRAVQRGLVDPAASVQIGIRTWNDDTMGIEQLTAPWVHEHGVGQTVRRVLERVGNRPCYLTFDIDCLDPAFAPGTGTPVAGGLSSATALAIWRAVCPRLPLVGADVVEVAPPFDVAGVTALAAATLVHDLLCAWPGITEAPR